VETAIIEDCCRRESSEYFSIVIPHNAKPKLTSKDIYKGKSRFCILKYVQAAIKLVTMKIITNNISFNIKDD
jgi:hypothetical protein